MKSLFLSLLALSLAIAMPANAHAQPALSSATISTYIPPATDPLKGDNGIPISAAVPMLFGSDVTKVDTNNNAVDCSYDAIAYFNGSYYLYGTGYSYGSLDFQLNAAGWLGYTYPYMVTYKSPDLMHWTPTANGRIYMGGQDPLVAPNWGVTQRAGVVYSPSTKKYCYWFQNGRLSEGPLVAISDSPEGPWTTIIKPTSESQATGAFSQNWNIAEGDPNDPKYAGTAWIVSGGHVVQQLNDARTGGIGPAVATGMGGEGVGLFEYNGWWYNTATNNCPNCGGANIYYLMSRSPLGPWINPTDGSTVASNAAIFGAQIGTTALVTSGPTGAFTQGQAHGVFVLPGPGGTRVPVMSILQYRTSPAATAIGSHGDNNLAISGHLWWPLKFAADGKILPLEQTTETTIPYPSPIATTVPIAYQVDGHISASSSIQQDWTIPAGTTVTTLMLPVFQRTYNLVLTYPNQDTVMNDALNVSFTLPSGVTYSWSVPATKVLWAPYNLVFNLPQPLTGGGRVSLKLSTQATNGTYGILVGAPSGNLPNGQYRTLADGNLKTIGNAAMLLSTRPTLPAAPVITRQPVSKTVTAGTSTWLLAEATGEGLSYQWQLNGADIPGCNAPDLPLMNVGAIHAGTYRCVISNGAGQETTVISDPAVFNVTFDSRVANASTLSSPTGITVGFNITGTTSNTLLIRSIGPTLSKFGLTGAATSPNVSIAPANGSSLFNSQVRTNTGWTTNGTSLATYSYMGVAGIQQAFAKTGAFPLQFGSADSALLVTVAPGSYLVQSNAGTGTNLIEIYELQTGSGGAGTRITNFSTLSGTAFTNPVMGFVVSGKGTSNLLLRDVGPTLASLGLASVLATPSLTLTSGGATVGSNTSWGGGTALSNAFAASGAFALPTNSADSALLSTVNPGSYTLQVTGGKGTNLLEIYQLK